MKKLIIVLLLVVMAEPAWAMTLGQYKDDVEMACYGDTTAANAPFSATQLVAWITEGRNLVAAMSGCKQRDTTITTVSGTSSYTLPSDFLRLDGVTTPPMQSASETSYRVIGLAKMTPESIGNDPSGAGVSEGMLQWGSNFPNTRGTAKVMFDPAPLGAYDVTVLYTAAPRTLTADSMSCDMPLGYQVAAVTYAKARALESMGMDDRAARADQLFQTIWNTLRVLTTETFISNTQSSSAGGASGQ